MKKQNLKSKISNMKGSSGITLVALIITIIILLILAVVAIGAVNNTGIIQYAENSADEYKDGRDKENTTLGNYMEILNHHKPTEDNTNPPEEEEILWAFVDLGDEEYELYLIRNIDELDLSQNKEVKAYIATYNEETDEIEYNENSEVITVELYSCYLNVYGGSIETLKQGEEHILNGGNIEEFGIKTLIFADGTESIPDKLYEETTMESVVIPSSVTSIGYKAFYKCTRLTNITLSSNLSSIDRHAFMMCSNLNNITLPSSITFVGEDAFSDCTNLTSITIKKAEGTLDLSNSGLTQEQIDNIVWAPEGE